MIWMEVLKDGFNIIGVVAGIAVLRQELRDAHAGYVAVVQVEVPAVEERLRLLESRSLEVKGGPLGD